MMLAVSWAKKLAVGRNGIWRAKDGTLAESPVNQRINIKSRKIRFRIPKKSDFEHSELSMVFVKPPPSHEYYNCEYLNHEYYNPEYDSHEYYNCEYYSRDASLLMNRPQ